MPTACRPKRLGLALDFDLTQTPAPAYLNTKKNPSRNYRAEIKDYNNMLINQVRPTNDLDPRHWQGNGFAGHVQYVPFIGTSPLRAGEKLERDMQISQMPRENGKPLNVSQMTRSAGMLGFTRALEDQERIAHEAAIDVTRDIRGVANALHRAEDGHNHYRNQVELNQQRHDRITKVAQALPGMRAAGLASINPRMGTCGSLQNLTGLRGQGGNEHWRTSTPWALGGAWSLESLSHN
ncbi:unnamed protein product [Effrenium voratum]|nr:unnamed protein product [Effrenium voratum]